MLFTTVQDNKLINNKGKKNYKWVQKVKESNREKLNSHIKTALQAKR